MPDALPAGGGKWEWGWQDAARSCLRLPASGSGAGRMSPEAFFLRPASACLWKLGMRNEAADCVDCRSCSVVGSADGCVAQRHACCGMKHNVDCLQGKHSAAAAMQHRLASPAGNCWCVTSSQDFAAELSGRRLE